MNTKSFVLVFLLLITSVACTDSPKPIKKASMPRREALKHQPSYVKEYKKMALEFERSLPSSMDFLIEQINDIDHYVYYKKSDNSRLIKYDLKTGVKETITPNILKGQQLVGIYAGNENIMFVVQNEYKDDYYTWLYNLRTMRFKEFDVTGGCGHIVNVDFDEINKLVYLKVYYRAPNYKSLGPTVLHKYNFDGQKISETTLDPGTNVDI